MIEPQILCDGAVIGNWEIPPFQLHTGDLLCLKVPGPCDSQQIKLLGRALTGRAQVSGLRLNGLVVHAAAPASRYRFLGLVPPPCPSQWLQRTVGMSLEKARALVAALGIRDDVSIGRLSATDRELLGLEAAFASRASVVLCATSGLDPIGLERVSAAVTGRLLTCSAIWLSHPYTIDSREEYFCPAGGACVEIKVGCRQVPIPRPA
jgi:hypothetical protein